MPKIEEYKPIESGLAELKRKYCVVHDVNTKEGYEQCKKDAREVGKFRISLESLRKEIKGPALERCKYIDSEAKRIQDEIAKIEDPLKNAYKAIDEQKKIAEQERVAEIERRIEQIKSYIDISYNSNSKEISDFIEIVDQVDCTEGFYEFTKAALIARNETLNHLNKTLKQVIQKELDEKRRAEEQAELEELRKIKAEQEEKERQLEHERQEIERQDREKQAEIEAKRKLEENKKHVAEVCYQAKKALMNIDGVDNNLAKLIVQAIAKKEIANVTINY